LRAFPHFRKFSAEQEDFVSRFKTGELTVDKGGAILVEGSHNAHLYTMLSGLAFRFKIIEDGRRQILNYILPGDLIGLQGSLTGEMQHSIETLKPSVLCVFERNRIDEIFVKHPKLAYDITWLAAREERMLDEHLLSIGRRTALERTAYVLSFLASRSIEAGMDQTGEVSLPVTQQHLADTLGLSIVHTNKTLKKLSDRELIKWGERSCTINDVEALARIANWQVGQTEDRPFI
jgi:CRP-like cAMP-binding protein